MRLYNLSLIMALLLITSCGDTAPQQQQPPQQATPAAPPLAAEAPPVPIIIPVSIARYTFIPQTVRVKTGTTIRWTNNDATSHSIKLLGSSAGAIMSPGQSYDLTLTDIGTYQYSCGIHAKMQGTIIVE